MGESTSHLRRLSAVLMADIAGYTRRVEMDTDGTVAAWKIARSEIIEPTIAEFSGSIVKFTGDGFLAEFSSVQDVVNCAVELQRRLIHSSLEFRMGVSLGDIVDDGKDIHGEGINIAARIESMAQPRSINITGPVYEAVKNRVDVSFEDTGEHTVKNVSEPVRVYRVVDQQHVTDIPDAPILELPDKPSIAVLPFTNMSGDPEQEYFSDGITEDIITGLSKSPDILVISRNSTFAFKDKAARVRDVREALGADYVMEGSVRKSGQRVRVTAQLIDAKTDRHLWSERYDRDLDDIFAVQDEVVGSIIFALTGAVDGVLEKTVREQYVSNTSTSMSAYDCYLKGRDHFYRHGNASFETAEQLYENAIKLDPEFARAYSALAWLHFIRFKLFLTHAFEDIRQKALDLGLLSVQIDSNDYRGHLVLGCIYMHDYNHSRGHAELDRAITINPNDTTALIFSAQNLVYWGRVEEALERLNRSLSLSPQRPDHINWMLGSAYFHLGEYEEALRILQLISSPDRSRRMLAATYAQLGQMKEARLEAEEFLKIVPNFSIANWAKTEPYENKKELQRYVDGLRMAGLPE